MHLKSNPIEKSDSKFIEVIRMLGQAMKRRLVTKEKLERRGQSFEDSLVLEDGSPMFLFEHYRGSKNFTEQLKQKFEVIHVANTKRVELASYQFKGVYKFV